MSITAISPVLSATDVRILESDHMTATLSTASGSRYTVVSRSGNVTVIHDVDGWVRQGASVEIRNGRLFLWGFNRKGHLVRRVETTRITSCYILSN